MRKLRVLNCSQGVGAELGYKPRLGCLQSPASSKPLDFAMSGTLGDGRGRGGWVKGHLVLLTPLCKNSQVEMSLKPSGERESHPWAWPQRSTGPQCSSKEERVEGSWVDCCTQRQGPGTSWHQLRDSPLPQWWRQADSWSQQEPSANSTLEVQANAESNKETYRTENTLTLPLPPNQEAAFFYQRGLFLWENKDEAHFGHASHSAGPGRAWLEFPGTSPGTHWPGLGFKSGETYVPSRVLTDLTETYLTMYQDCPWQPQLSLASLLPGQPQAWDIRHSGHHWYPLMSGILVELIPQSVCHLFGNTRNPRSAVPSGTQHMSLWCDGCSSSLTDMHECMYVVGEQTELWEVHDLCVRCYAFGNSITCPSASYVYVPVGKLGVAPRLLPLVPHPCPLVPDREEMQPSPGLETDWLQAPICLVPAYVTQLSLTLSLWNGVSININIGVDELIIKFIVNYWEHHPLEI